MLRHPIHKIVRALAVALTALVVLVGGAGLASASSWDNGPHHGHHGHHHHYYAASVFTKTDLKVGHRYACAYVRSDVGKPKGTVTFTLKNHKTMSATAHLKHGKACVGLPRLYPGKYKLTATYNGWRYFKPSSDTVYFKVWKHHRHHDRW